MTRLTQTEQLQIIQNLCQKVWQAYTHGDISPMKEVLNKKEFGSHFIETVEFFLNKEYATYKLNHEINFPECLKPSYFSHLCTWSIDFKKRYQELNKQLIDIDTDLVIIEKRKLLKLFSKNVHSESVAKFGVKDNSGSEQVHNFQMLVFKLAKKELGFEEDFKEISEIYFNESKDNVELFKVVFSHKGLIMDLTDKDIKEPKKIKI